MKFIKFFLVILIASNVFLLLHAQDQKPTEDKTSTKNSDLKIIMNGLLDDTKLLTEGIFLEDFTKIRLAANNIANHPKPSSETLKKVKANLAEEMGLFKGFDIKVHNASLEIAKSASNKDLVSVVSTYHKMIDGCLSCHSQYKNRISSVLNSSAEEKGSSKTDN